MVTQPVRAASRKADSMIMAEDENIIKLPVITGEHTYLIIERESTPKSRFMARFRSIKEKLKARS